MLPTAVFNKRFGHLGECSSADPNIKRFQDLEIQYGPDALDGYRSTKASIQGSRAGQHFYQSCNKHQSAFADIGEKMEDTDSLIGTEAMFNKEKKRRFERMEREDFRSNAARGRYIINRMFDRGRTKEEGDAVPQLEQADEVPTTTVPRVKTKLVQQQPTKTVRPEVAREESTSVLPPEENAQEAIAVPKPKFKSITESPAAQPTKRLWDEE
jgi:hypothetical protein